MEQLRILLFLAVGVFSIFHGVRSDQQWFIYGGAVLALIGIFNVYAGWKQKQDK